MSDFRFQQLFLGTGKASRPNQPTGSILESFAYYKNLSNTLTPTDMMYESEGGTERDTLLTNTCDPDTKNDIGPEEGPIILA
jgi:hypothetical protein